MIDYHLRKESNRLKQEEWKRNKKLTVNNQQYKGKLNQLHHNFHLQHNFLAVRFDISECSSSVVLIWYRVISCNFFSLKSNVLNFREKF